MGKDAAPEGVVESPLSQVKPIVGVATGPIIGIDLGTTYSCVAFVKDGHPYVIPSRQGYNTIPSIVALNARRKLIVGHPARAQMLTNPKQTVFGAKRLIGRRFHSPVVKQVKQRFHYDIVEGRAGEAAVLLGGAVWSLQQVSALILLEAREIAEHHLESQVQRAVITVPAYYNDHQRQAVREAGALAGLQVERIINEPTAAALAFGWSRKLQKTILVYDLGGGTFDASLLRLSDSVYEVVSTGGDTFLGGVDFDNALVDRLASEFQARTGAVFSGGAVAHQRLVDAAEQAKRILSEQRETSIQLPFVATVDGKPVDLDVKLTRADLDLAVAPLVDRTLQVCREVLRAGKVTPAEVEEVLLVGGMSRMPQVHEKIAQFLGKPPYKGVHPDEAVALGAALFAHSLGQEDGVVLIDVLPMSIGIGLPGGHLKRLIERNTPLPHVLVHRHSTTRNNQKELEIPIFQGDSERLEQAEYLGSVKLGPLPRGPKGTVHVDLTISLSAECLLTLSAREPSRGLEERVTLTTRDTPEAVRARLMAPVQDELEAEHIVASAPAERGSWLDRATGLLRPRKKASHAIVVPEAPAQRPSVDPQDFVPVLPSGAPSAPIAPAPIAPTPVVPAPVAPTPVAPVPAASPVPAPSPEPAQVPPPRAPAVVAALVPRPPAPPTPVRVPVPLPPGLPPKAAPVAAAPDEEEDYIEIIMPED